MTLRLLLQGRAATTALHDTHAPGAARDRSSGLVRALHRVVQHAALTFTRAQSSKPTETPAFARRISRVTTDRRAPLSCANARQFEILHTCEGLLSTARMLELAETPGRQGGLSRTAAVFQTMLEAIRQGSVSFLPPASLRGVASSMTNRFVSLLQSGKTPVPLTLSDLSCASTACTQWRIAAEQRLDAAIRRAGYVSGSDAGLDRLIRKERTQWREAERELKSLLDQVCRNRDRIRQMITDCVFPALQLTIARHIHTQEGLSRLAERLAESRLADYLDMVTTDAGFSLQRKPVSRLDQLDPAALGALILAQQSQAPLGSPLRIALDRTLARLREEAHPFIDGVCMATCSDTAASILKPLAERDHRKLSILLDLSASRKVLLNALSQLATRKAHKPALLFSSSAAKALLIRETAEKIERMPLGLELAVQVNREMEALCDRYERHVFLNPGATLLKLADLRMPLIALNRSDS